MFGKVFLITLFSFISFANKWIYNGYNYKLRFLNFYFYLFIYFI